MAEWYDFPNVKFTKMLSFFPVSRGLQPDLPLPFGRKFQFCLPSLSWFRTPFLFYVVLFKFSFYSHNLLQFAYYFQFLDKGLASVSKRVNQSKLFSHFSKVEVFIRRSTLFNNSELSLSTHKFNGLIQEKVYFYKGRFIFPLSLWASTNEGQHPFTKISQLLEEEIYPKEWIWMSQICMALIGHRNSWWNECFMLTQLLSIQEVENKGKGGKMRQEEIKWGSMR